MILHRRKSRCEKWITTYDSFLFSRSREGEGQMSGLPFPLLTIRTNPSNVRGRRDELLFVLDLIVPAVARLLHDVHPVGPRTHRTVSPARPERAPTPASASDSLLSELAHALLAEAAPVKVLLLGLKLLKELAVGRVP